LEHTRLAQGSCALYIGDLLMANDDDARLKKLKFRAWRRGFREADLILGPFADKHVQAMTPAELDWFEALLEQPDHDLYGWIVGTGPTPAEFDHEIMNRIKAFRLEVGAGDARGG
jgi:antitoxin CptB